ncbi:MAG: helicase-related protein [Acidimicrobiales bacterium]
MRVRVRDRLWEVEATRATEGSVLLDLRKSDARPGPLTLTVVAGLEPDLCPEPAARLRFDVGNPVRFGQLHDALALTMAHGRGDLTALEHGRIEVEPYQLVPTLVALEQPRARLLIADDVGLGKTIEAGLVMLELARRGRADRVLIACPAGLQDQWIDEMEFRFNIGFAKVDSRRWLELRREHPANISPWAAVPHAISSIDYLKANTAALAAAPRFDLVIIDEAHHVARAYAGPGRSTVTDRSRLARLLADHSRELLLLSATPHNGYAESFASLVQLLGTHLAADDGRLDPEVVRPHVLRRLKNDVSRGDPPRPISGGRNVVPIEIDPTAREQEVFQRLRGHSSRVLRAVRADKAAYLAEAFTMEVLRKRALSSPYALATSLRRRAARLGSASEGGVALSRRGQDVIEAYRGDSAMDEDDHAEAEATALDTVAQNLGDELDRERRLVDELLARVERITAADDTKLLRLRVWLDTFWDDHPAERVIVFSEYRDTIDYLEANLGVAPIVRVDGSMPQAARREALDEFAGLPAAVLLATDAAGEGLNLQDSAHVVVHYELPWNPNRLEQRNGRVDRYGQECRVEIRYFHLRGTRDAEILDALRVKLARISAELGSSTDVLGVAGSAEVIEGLLEGVDQTELEARLERAAAEVRAYLDRTGALALLRGRTPDPGERSRLDSARRNAALLLPGFEAFRDLVTGVVRQEGGDVRERDGLMTITAGPLLSAYPGVPAERFDATFSRQVALRPLMSAVAFLTPAHPLVRAVLQRVRARLYTPGNADRVVPRAVAGGESGWLVTFTARVASTDGQTLEEPLLAVYVPRGPDGSPGRPSSDEDADLRRLRDPGRPGDVADRARNELAAGFDEAVALATSEAVSRLDGRYMALREQVDSALMRVSGDLDRWRLAERAEAHRRFQLAGPGEAVQLALLAEVGHGRLETLDEALAAVDQEFTARLSALAGVYGVGPAHGPEPVGCLLVVGVG